MHLVSPGSEQFAGDAVVQRPEIAHGQMVMAVDGGGSKITAALAYRDGLPGDYISTVLRDTDVNRNRVGDAAAAATLRSVRDELLEKADLDKRTWIGTAFCGLAGIDTEGARANMRMRLGDLADTVVVDNDAVPLLGMLPEAQGVVLVAGTGSICLARDAAGGMVEAIGGNGRLLDQGGGAWLTNQCLERVEMTLDGRHEAPEGSMFVERVLGAVAESLGMQEIERFSDLHEWLYSASKEAATRNKVHRAVTPLLFDMAEEAQPEPDALSVVGSGVEHLAKHVWAAVKRLRQRAGSDLTDIDLVVSGSPLVKRQSYRDAVSDRLRQDYGIIVNDGPIVAESLFAAMEYARRIAPRDSGESTLCCN